MEEILRLEVLQARAMLAFAEDALTRENSRARYLGPTILPPKTVESLEYMYLKGAGNIPVAAEIVDFNSPSPIGSRRGKIDIVMGELVTIKRKYRIDAKTLVRLEAAMRSAAPNELKGAVRQIFDDTETVIANVAARIEKMVWEALSTGQLAYSSRDVQFTIDYGLPASNVGYATHDWTDLDRATPISDLMQLCDAIETEYGVRPARAVTRRATWTKLLRNRKEVQLYVHGQDMAARPLVPGELNGLLAQLELPAFATYDVQVGEEDESGLITNSYLIPADTVILLPPSNVEVGNTLFGPTPTEIMNAKGYGTAIKEMQERPRIVARVYKEGDDPGVIYTAAEATAIPTMPGIQYVGILHTVPRGS